MCHLYCAKATESELLVFLFVNFIAVVVVQSHLNRWQSKRTRTLCFIWPNNNGNGNGNKHRN